MNRLWSVLGVLVLVVASAAVPALGLVSDTRVSQQQTTTTTPTDADGTNTTDPANATAPGARLAGVVGVQGAEIGGELESRRFQAQLDAASTNDSKASVVAAQATRSRTRLTELETELEQLQAARRNGSISADQYRARAARLSARLQAVERVSNRTAAAADRLPQETLERNGVNVTAIRRVRTDASELSGPEVAEAARTIAGANAGRGFGPPDPDERGERGRSEGQGPPEEPGERGRDGSAAGPEDGSSPANETDTDETNGGDRGEGPPTERGRSDDAERGSSSGQGPEQAGNGSDERRGNSSAAGGSDGGDGPPSDGGSSGDDSDRPDDAGGNDGASEGSRSADESDA